MIYMFWNWITMSLLMFKNFHAYELTRGFTCNSNWSHYLDKKATIPEGIVMALSKTAVRVYAENSSSLLVKCDALTIILYSGIFSYQLCAEMLRVFIFHMLQTRMYPTYGNFSAKIWWAAHCNGLKSCKISLSSMLNLANKDMNAQWYLMKKSLH